MSAALARRPMLLLLAALAASCLLHVDRAPQWCTAVAAAALLWRWLHARGRIALPNRWLLSGTSLLLLCAVLVSFRTLNGLAAGSALLIVMGAAKLLEARNPRDAVVVVTVALVLTLAAALDRQSLARLPLYVGTGWLALAGIAALGGVQAAHSVRHAFRVAGKAALLAVPLAVLSFVLVPRLPGALWSMPGDGRAETGLADEMSPGSISELSISEDIAFRVSFDGPPPAPAQRYWRGPVLHEFDGYTWRRKPGLQARSPVEQPLSPPLRYHVMLEPQGRNYLFTLDTLAKIDGLRYQRLFDGEVHAWRELGSPTAYDAVSHLQSREVGDLSALARRLDTRLPPERNLRSIELAQQLRSTQGSDAAYAQRVLDYFRDGGFEYSLTPPLLDLDSIDDLLFNTRLGYCGHFASAFVVLMRAVNVPARVVTGYLGGSWNSMGGYYAVRQSDAHAWAEVWLEGSGWTRFDPTAVVAPERLTRAAADLLAGRRAGGTLLGEANWLRGVRDVWEAAGGWWQAQVVNFNRAQQQNLLAKLGLDRLDYGGMVALLTAAAVLWTLLLAALLAQRGPRLQRDRLARLWERFLVLLQRRGIAVADHDGPDAIRRRAQQQLPEAAGEIDLFAAEYARLRYGGGNATDDRALAVMQTRLSAIARATRARRRRQTATAAQG